MKHLSTATNILLLCLLLSLLILSSGALLYFRS